MLRKTFFKPAVNILIPEHLRSKATPSKPLKTTYPNTSTTTLNLQKEQVENSERFTIKRLTKNGKGDELSPEAEEVVDIFAKGGIPNHQEPMRELGERSQVVRAMNLSGGNNINVRTLRLLSQIKEMARK